MSNSPKTFDRNLQTVFCRENTFERSSIDRIPSNGFLWYFGVRRPSLIVEVPNKDFYGYRGLKERENLRKGCYRPQTFESSDIGRIPLL